MNLNSSVTEIKGVGTSVATKLENLSITTIKDLLFHIPFKYRDTTELLSIKQFKEVGEGTFLAQIVDVKNIYTKWRKVITKVRVKDDTSYIDLSYFNQSYLAKSLEPDSWYIFDGKISVKGKSRNIYNPKYEKFVGDIDGQTTLGKIFGTYHETAGLTSRQIRKILLTFKENLDDILKEYIPNKILTENNLISISNAIKQIHFPDSREDLEEARYRIAFEEMLRIAYKIEAQLLERSKQKGEKIGIDNLLHEKLLKSLEFKLTNDQVNSISEIYMDISKTQPMNRLLNGDVGSGKTVVAASAILQTVNSGYSAILLAPTTVLAKQHFETLKTLLKEFNVDVELCISEQKTISDADNKLIVGTHAILHQKNLPADLNLVIIDEQHRFGVKQRKYLLNQNQNLTPHYLTMSATPIPRSLTEIFFGGIDVSTILEKPTNRLEIDTKYVPHEKREDCFKWIREKIEKSKKQEQAFLIYPLIEDNNTETKSVKNEFEKLSNSVFNDLEVALLHGRLKDQEKNQILEDFKKNKYDILISTSVIEVGIDIPNATIIVIENAERFGLAQLHQLRGRVGRNDIQSYCFVIPTENIDDNEGGKERLKYFSTHNSGFDVAEYDLERRGPGEVYGIKQSGVPQFKVANISDLDLLKKTRSVARKLIMEDNSQLDSIINNLFK